MPSPCVTQPIEVRCQAVEHVLPPGFVGMLVALRAFEADAQEELADDRRQFFGFPPGRGTGRRLVAGNVLPRAS